MGQTRRWYGRLDVVDARHRLRTVVSVLEQLQTWWSHLWPPTDTNVRSWLIVAGVALTLAVVSSYVDRTALAWTGSVTMVVALLFAGGGALGTWIESQPALETANAIKEVRDIGRTAPPIVADEPVSAEAEPATESTRGTGLPSHRADRALLLDEGDLPTGLLRNGGSVIQRPGQEPNLAAWYARGLQAYNIDVSARTACYRSETASVADSNPGPLRGSASVVFADGVVGVLARVYHADAAGDVEHFDREMRASSRSCLEASLRNLVAPVIGVSNVAAVALDRTSDDGWFITITGEVDGEALRTFATWDTVRAGTTLVEIVTVFDGGSDADLARVEAVRRAAIDASARRIDP